MYKNITQAVKDIFSINYYNGRIKKNLEDYLKTNNLQLSDIIEPKERYCKQCKKLLTSKQQKFCSNSCAAKYNNKGRLLSKETKNKIAATIKETTKDKNTIELNCSVCGKSFKVKRYRQRIFCSKKCAIVFNRETIRNIQLQKVKEGTHKGWNSRNITSYPERFWEKVLTNNNISYTREDFSTKKYFLDFLIIKNNKKIDLEIDGKQHNYPERAEKDRVRDEYLTNLEYIVYRVKWNSINSEKGKQEMQNKIDRFVAFYNNI